MNIEDMVKEWLSNQNVFTGMDEMLSPHDTELARLVTDCIKDLGLVEADQWVSVKNGIPNKGVDVLVYCEDTKEQFVAFYMSPNRFQFASGGGNTFMCNPSHWKPLPKPPTK